MSKNMNCRLLQLARLPEPRRQEMVGVQIPLRRVQWQYREPAYLERHERTVRVQRTGNYLP